VDVPDELLTHLSPLGWEHVNLTGDHGGFLRRISGISGDQGGGFRDQAWAKRARERGGRAREGGGDAADFDFGLAEADQQAQGLARRPQVVPALRKMHVAQRASHLGFDDDLVLGSRPAANSPTITSS
jgi:hypothetical protein